MTTRSGYALSFKGFLPVDFSDLDKHAAALEAVKAARRLAEKATAEGDLTLVEALFGALEIETFDVKPISRRAKDAG